MRKTDISVQQMQTTYPQQHQHAWDRVVKSTAKKYDGAFPMHVIGASRANILESESWYVIAVRQGILRRINIFVIHKIRQL